MKQIIQKTLNKDSSKVQQEQGKNFEEQALNDINEAYALFLNINVLDVSKEGQEIWEITKKTYDNKIDKVES